MPPVSRSGNVTIRDVARTAGVSPATVSLLLNGRPGISEATSQRVAAAMSSLGYRPTSQGRPLHRATQRNVAVIYARRVVLDGHLSPLSTAWIKAIRESSANAGFHLTQFAADDQVEQDLLFAHALAEGAMDGAILIGMADRRDYASRLVAAGIPTVAINTRPEANEFSYVAMDNYGGGRLAARRFVGLGHRRIAYLLPPTTAVFHFIQDRLSGFTTALREAGLDPVSLGHVEPSALEKNAIDLRRRFNAEGITALFCLASDDLAGRLIDAWEKQGFAVPAALSVIGFDNLGVVTASGLRITSVDFDKHAVGAEAVRVLERLCEFGTPVAALATLIRTTLFEGDTLAPPPA
jgi:LacI family transcriptional regulator